MKNRVFFLFSFFLSALLCVAGNPTLKVNGEEIGKTLKQITFDGDNAVLNFSDGSTQTCRMDVVEVLFQSSNVSLSPVNICLLSTLVQDELVVENAPHSQLVQVYDFSGRLHLQTTTLASSSLHLDVSALHQGVYVLRIGTQSIRFIKQ